MNFDNIVPAINSNFRDLSSEEFQKLLHYWFEEKGLEKDMRSYLRTQMINVLKNTVIGRNLVKPNFGSVSLSKQAVNLILAEYLIQHNCHYTFSIFNTEVSLSHVLPGHPSIFDSATLNKQEKWQFDEENLLNIFELIGIPKATLECKEIVYQYYDNNDTRSILSCLIWWLCKNIKEKYVPAPILVENYMQNIDVKNEDKFVLHVGQILSCSRLPPEDVNEVLAEIRNSYLNEKEAAKNEFENVMKELERNGNDAVRSANELQKRNSVLEKKILKLCRENTKLKSYTEQLLSREKNLLADFEVKTTALTQELSVLKSSSNDVATNIPICENKHCSTTCIENEKLVHKLSLENNTLKEENLFQKGEIEDLVVRYRTVVKEFETCRSKLTLLSSRLSDETIYAKSSGIKHQITDTQVSRVDSESSSNSITEEILENARLKLKELEMESLEIEQKFNKIITCTPEA